MTTRATRWSVLLFLIATWPSAWVAHATVPAISITATPVMRFEAEAFAGSQYRKQVDDVMLSEGTLAIMDRLRPVIEFCDSRIAERGAVHVSVATKDEARAFAASQSPGATIDYVDVACPRAWLTAAFASIDAGEAARANGFLDRAQALAPYWAEPYTERGFLLNAGGDRTRALASYRRALELAEAWPSSRYSLAIALRGIGWSLVERGDYAGGRQAYRRSLEIEPGNALATNELAFIEKYESKGAPNTPVFDTMVPQDEASLANRKFVFDTKRLEKTPLADDAADLRRELMAWLAGSRDVTVIACDLLQLGHGKDHAENELLVQYLLGHAAFQIEHPDLKNDVVAVQLGGVHSALRAYRALIATHAQLRTDAMDLLVRQDDAGDLDKVLKPIVEERCATPKSK